MKGDFTTPIVTALGVAVGTEIYHMLRYGIGAFDPVRALFVGSFVALLMLAPQRLASPTASAGGAERK